MIDGIAYVVGGERCGPSTVMGTNEGYMP